MSNYQKTNNKKKTHKITPKKFDIDKFTLPTEIVEKTFSVGNDKTKKYESKQYTSFPKYKYEPSSNDNNSKINSGEDSLYILTDVIDFKKRRSFRNS
jgi:hypothetical protein